MPQHSKPQRVTAQLIGVTLVLPHQTEAEAEADRKAMMEDDAAYFQRAPHRSYRVRPAVLAEMHETLRRGGLNNVPAGGTWFAMVHQVKPGFRVRQIAILPKSTPADPGERRARTLWRRHAPPGYKAGFDKHFAPAGGL